MLAGSPGTASESRWNPSAISEMLRWKENGLTSPASQAVKDDAMEIEFSGHGMSITGDRIKATPPKQGSDSRLLVLTSSATGCLAIVTHFNYSISARDAASEDAAGDRRVTYCSDSGRHSWQYGMCLTPLANPNFREKERVESF